MSTRNIRCRHRTKAKIDLEFAKLDVYVRRHEADILYRHAVTDETIRGWKNQRGYVV